MSDSDDPGTRGGAGFGGLPVHRPGSALTPYVRSMTAYDMAGVEVVHHGVPSPDLTVILALGRPLTVGWTADRAQGREFHGLVSGLHDGPAFIFPTADHAGVQLAVTPLGARALFGLPAGAIAAGLVDLGDLWAGVAAELIEALHDCRTWPERFARIETTLRTRLQGDDSIRPELMWAWDRIVAGAVPATGALADEIGWSRGYFARVFAAEYGLRPKETVRVARFSRARIALGRPGASLADVAAQCGYADQAHLTREWRRLAGCTPSGWRQEVSSFVQDDPRTATAASTT
ncbi:MAG: AraC family transcriptional regulator [Nakamurella sp.]